MHENHSILARRMWMLCALTQMRSVCLFWSMRSGYHLSLTTFARRTTVLTTKLSSPPQSSVHICKLIIRPRVTHVVYDQAGHSAPRTVKHLHGRPKSHQSSKMRWCCPVNMLHSDFFQEFQRSWFQGVVVSQFSDALMIAVDRCGDLEGLTTICCWISHNTSWIEKLAKGTFASVSALKQVLFELIHVVSLFAVVQGGWNSTRLYRDRFWSRGRHLKLGHKKLARTKERLNFHCHVWQHFVED